MSAGDKVKEIVQDLTGMWFPDGDEDELREAARAWRTFADDVKDITSATHKSAQDVIDNNRGKSIDAFEAFWRKYHGGGKGYLDDVASAAEDMAKALDKFADQIADAKKKIEHELEIAGAVLVAGTALALFTGGISEVAAAGATEAIVAAASTAGVAVSATVAEIAGTVLATAAMGSIEAITVDVVVAQGGRNLLGEQHGINLAEIKDAGVSGLLLGGAFGAAGRTAKALGGARALRDIKVPRLELAGTGRASLARDSNGLRNFGRDFKCRVLKKDPVDMASGRMVLPQADTHLPGALPLAFTRTFESSYRAGHWFGPTWASTADERLELDEQGVVHVGADGTLRPFPHPEPGGTGVQPETGPPQMLRRTEAGDFELHDPATGHTRVFTEHAPGLALLEEIGDRNGHWINFAYDETGAPTEITHSGGYRLKLTTQAHRITALHLADAAADGGDQLLAAYGYDETGHLATVTTPASETPLRFENDTHGRITAWIDTNGSRFDYTYDDQDRCTAQTGSAGHLRSTFTYDREPNTGLRRTRLTDSLGHTSTYLANESLQVVAETDPLGQTTRTDWDRFDHPVATTDALGHVTRRTYDEAGNLTRITLPDGTTGQATYNDLGLPTQVIEPGGTTWRHTYDAAGNLLTTTDPAGADTRYAYSTSGDLTTITDALGHTRHLTCNQAGLPITVTDPLGNTATVERDAFGRVTCATDPLGNTTRLSWTPQGNPAWREAPDGARETWTWDGEGNLLAHTDAAGHTTCLTHGSFDLPLTRTDPDGTTYGFAYDTELRLTQVTNPQGLSWTYSYDPAGCLTSETDFNGRTLTYTHDAAGRLASRTNGAGETLTFTRDAFGRTTSFTTNDGTETAYEYAPSGHLVRIANPDATVTWQHDGLGRVLTETVDGRTTAYSYNDLGQRISRTTPTGFVSRWSYDAAGRPASLSADGGNLSFTYDATGREVERRLGRDMLLTQNWDSTGRLTAQALTRHRTPDDDLLLQHRTYAYHVDGSLSEIGDLTSGMRHFDLDSAGRVTGVRAHGWTETYAYDTAGNLTHAAAPDHPANGDHDFTGTLLTRAGHTTYEHDAQGRLTRKARKLLNGQTRTWNYAYNAEDRLTQVTTPEGETWRYTYDPLGRRTAKYRLADDGTTAASLTFTWDGTRLAEQAASDGQITTWDYAPETHCPLTQTTRVTPAGTPRFHAVITDLSGTPTELVTTEGDIAWQNRTTLWGTPLPPPADSVGRTVTTDCPLRFPGQYLDPETGFHYNHFRHYDPETARYTTPDPLGLVPAPNHHAYVTNPHSWTDPNGLAACEPDPTWGGRVQFGSPDALGRSTTMHATITRDMIGEGTHAASRIKPRGFQGGPPVGPHARGHLLGRQLGGSGDIEENLVTLVHRPVNTPNMARLEGQIRRAAEGGETIQYTVKPIYDGNNLVPRGVTLEAHGSNGFRFHSRDGNEFNSITLLNRSK
ncbi:DNA/RNA non-specific endonuclease [Streptomyces lydicus]|uniref:DNA/RNA non-specific endonuclease n=1 Tax=Streptomyces lydicus TaxID=47763 RepID=UPI0036EDA1C8